MIMYIIMGVLLWFLVGRLITSVSGIIYEKKLMKYYKDKEEFERDIIIRNMLKGCYDDEVSDGTLFIEALLWPLTMFYSFIGYLVLSKDLKSKENKDENARID